jgi:murein DD-endopeptidase MepM/ murein hydrolase activator NlpD
MKIRWILFSAMALGALVLAAAFIFLRPLLATVKAGRHQYVSAFIRSPQDHQDWVLPASERCNAAPFLFPTRGFAGYLWGDSFRPGHKHQGIDIFAGTPAGETPVYASYDGFLTRLPDWRSTVIIRVPSDPLQPDQQIWLYYTHLADIDGNSYIDAAFPPGTSDFPITAGALLGYQGNFSGTVGNPTGVHLHFSIVKSAVDGAFLNELEIENTIDPSPYLGLNLNGSLAGAEIPLCIPPVQ